MNELEQFARIAYVSLTLALFDYRERNEIEQIEALEVALQAAPADVALDAKLVLLAIVEDIKAGLDNSDSE